MKVRNKKICQTCRSRKMRCDGQKPACSQCVHSERECCYPQDFSFILETKAKNSNPSDRGGEEKPVTSSVISVNRRSQPQPPLVINMIPGTLQDPVQGMVLLIMRNFMPEEELSAISRNKPTESRICGNWVEVLPALSCGSQGEALFSAISCLAASISHYRHNSLSTRAQLLHEYGLAVSSLKGELERPHIDIASQDEIAVAIMCLTLTESIAPTSMNSWWRHVDGVGEWMRIWPARSFSLGIRHKIFIGFRPLLILKAFSSRQTSFLSNENWKMDPFEVHVPSAMQRLLSEVSGVPTILELIDTIDHSSLGACTLIATESISCLITTYNDLQRWGDPLEAEPSTGLFCRKVPSQGLSAWAGRTIWFPSVSVANVVMHLWAFRAICLIEIRKIQTRFSHVSCDWPVQSDCGLGGHSQSDLRELCVRIVQGTGFLLQDRMALFGPLSIMFPLSIASEVFNMDGEPSAALWKLSSDLVQRSLLSKVPM